MDRFTEEGPEDLIRVQEARRDRGREYEEERDLAEVRRPCAGDCQAGLMVLGLAAVEQALGRKVA